MTRTMQQESTHTNRNGRARSSTSWWARRLGSCACVAAMLAGALGSFSQAHGRTLGPIAGTQEPGGWTPIYIERVSDRSRFRDTPLLGRDLRGSPSNPVSYCVLSGQNVVDNNKRLQAYSYMYATSESEMLVSEPRMRTLYTAPPGYMIDEVECSAPERIVVVSGEYATPWRQLRFYVHFPSYQGLGWCRIWGDQFGDDHDALGYELQYTWRVKIKPIYPRAVGRLRPWRGFRH